MLNRLKFKNVGPAPELEISFRKRLNFLTGDNGLGKSFLLDAAWWALTRTWARRTVLPHPPTTTTENASISYSYDKVSDGEHSFTSTFDRKSEEWSKPGGRPSIPGLVIYAQVDGGFSVWDPARNYWKKHDPNRPGAFLFTAKDVWEGNAWCEGLIRDWASWQLEKGDSFEHLKNVLRVLSPSPDEQLEPGKLRRVSVSDPKRYPTLKMPYGHDIPIIHASAGMRRIISLAYILVWTWQEHLVACELQNTAPAQNILTSSRNYGLPVWH